MKVIYIAHNIAGDPDGNIQRILRICESINRQFPHIVPFAPYVTDVLSMDDNIPGDRQRGIKNDQQHFYRKSFDELWDFSHSYSQGVQDEIALCKKLNIQTFKCWIDEDGKIHFESKFKKGCEDIEKAIYNIRQALLFKPSKGSKPLEGSLPDPPPSAPPV